MKSIERFFRRYILSTIGSDPLLSPQYPAAWRVFCDCRSGKCKKTPNFPIEELSRHIEADSGQFHIDAQAEEILADSGAWGYDLNRQRNRHLGAGSAC